MITPSFSLTATERVLPRLALDFTTATLDPRITFARVGNTATLINSSGFIELVNEDTPRFDYSPTTLACKGLLVEEARTNIVRNSNEFTAATWTLFRNNTALLPVVTASSGTSPDGTNNAFKITFNSPASTDISRIQTTFTAPGGTATASIYLKAFNSGDVGKIVLFRGTAAADYLTVTLTADWQRITRTEAGTFGEYELGLRPVSGSSSGEVNVLVYGAQCEAGAFPTSYIPTEASAVTRNADVATMTGTNFSDWFNPTEGTFVTEFIYSGLVGANYILTASKGNTNNASVSATSITGSRFQLRVADGAGTTVGAVTYTSLGVPEANRLYQAAMKYKTNDYGFAMDGNAVVADAAGTYSGTADNLKIGARFDSFGSFLLNGHMRKILYYPQTLTNAELQAFSKQG